MKQTVYIASPESQQIHVWNLNHEGALTLTQVVDVPGQVQPMVVSPDKRWHLCWCSPWSFASWRIVLPRTMAH